MSTKDYRASHQASGYGARYKNNYKEGYYFAQWNKLEMPILKKVLAELSIKSDICLDFACGTGRITACIAPFFRKVMAVDISKEMLKEAPDLNNVEFGNVDITRAPLSESYDIVTAFRFFLNSEPLLRKEALKAIYRHLNSDGYLICNIHMNATSMMGCVYRFLKFVTGKDIHSVLKDSDFTFLLSENGFDVKQIEYFSFLPRPGRALPWLMQRVIRPVEIFCKFLRVPDRFAQSYLIVAQKKEAK